MRDDIERLAAVIKEAANSAVRDCDEYCSDYMAIAAARAAIADMRKQETQDD
jgi:hypothetical protein